MDVTHALQILIKGKTLAGPALKTAGDQVARLSKVVTLAGRGLLTLGKIGLTALVVGLTAAVAGVLALAAGIVSLTTALTAGIAKLTQYAAELELMRRAMWGIAGEAMPAMLAALREASAFMVTERGLLRQYHMAYMLLGKDLAERLPEALQYLTKVSGATGDSVEYLMDRLVRSVGRLSTRWMAYIGTVVSVEEAEARAAEMFGVLTDELTYQQKQAGMLDRVLAKLAASTSVMPDILGTTKQMSEALKASWKDLWGDVTSHFLPVSQALFKILLKLVAAFKRLVSEGGALYRPIRTVVAAFTVLYETLGDLLDRALEVEEGATSALERFANNVISMAWKAVQWGSNIAVNLAIGIIRGASVALIGAMNFISSLLAHWLAPGSAPLVVSNILNWGASAFTEFLRGFSMADFDVIESVQAPLKRALAILVDLGEIGAKAAGEYFINLSEMMTEAIATGNLEEVFAKLGEIPGGYGESLAELFRRQIDLATAVEILAKAEERLAAARKNEEATGKALSKQAREYNKLAREGADPAILAAKLAEVKASYESLVIAREETEEAEEAEEAAKAQVKWFKEQARLQERLLNQLIAMGEAFADLVRPDDEEEPFVIPPIEWPEGYLLPIDEAFEALKERIRAKFAELWADLRRQWEESGVVEWMARVKEAWELSSLKAWWDDFWADVKEGGLAYALGELWNKFLEGHPTLSATLNWLGKIWQTFKDWVADKGWPWVLTQWDAWSAWWSEHGPGIKTKIGEIWQTFKDWVADEGWPFVLEEWGKWAQWWKKESPAIARLIAVLKEAYRLFFKELWDLVTGGRGWDAVWDWALATYTVWWRNVRILISGGMAIFRGLLSLGLRLLEGDWEGAWEAMQGIVVTYWDTINRLTYGKFFELIALIGNFIGSLRTTGANLGQALLDAITNKIWKIPGVVVGAIVAAIAALLGEKWRISNAGHVLMDSLRDAITSKAHEIADALRRLVRAAIEAFKRAFGFGSPSTIMLDFGESLAESVALGIARFEDQPAIAIQRMVDLTTAKGFRPPTPTGLPAYGKGFKPRPLIEPGDYATGFRPRPVIEEEPAVTINNYFGRDSIRSAQDVLLIADQIQRSMELKGVRARIN